MRASLTPALLMAPRIASSCTASLKRTVTTVPPLKSTPSGMPCQKSMDNIPATVTTNENPRKYHFFPIQSTFTSRKNSTVSSLRNCHPEHREGSAFDLHLETRNMKLETVFLSSRAELGEGPAFCSSK